jgi:hypothetical protein
LQVWNELAERFLENATRYESGIPKIRADMLQEIKQFRISEKAKCTMEDQLKNIPFSDFKNYKPFPTELEKDPLIEKIDQTDQELIMNDFVEDSSEPPLEVPSFHLQSNNNILKIQRVQNEIIQLYHQNFKLWEIFKEKRYAFLLYVELLIPLLDKPHILSKTAKRLKNANFKPNKRIINKVISLATSTKFQLLPKYLIKRKQKIAEVRNTSTQPNLKFKINDKHFHGIADSG